MGKLYIPTLAEKEARRRAYWTAIKQIVIEEGEKYVCFEEECGGLLQLQREASRFGLAIYHDDDEGSYYAVLA